jgi:hypothetical protein
MWVGGIHTAGCCPVPLMDVGDTAITISAPWSLRRDTRHFGFDVTRALLAVLGRYPLRDEDAKGWILVETLVSNFKSIRCCILLYSKVLDKRSLHLQGWNDVATNPTKKLNKGGILLSYQWMISWVSSKTPPLASFLIGLVALLLQPWRWRQCSSEMSVYYESRGHQIPKEHNHQFLHSYFLSTWEHP